uniref:MTSS I-BAR domain containing 1 n=1 Tax=Oryzias sinensis TaxID=183150 RepID=A0A8C7ZW39_9TELE
MEAVIEKECSALGGLFQTLIGDMKVPPFAPCGGPPISGCQLRAGVWSVSAFYPQKQTTSELLQRLMNIFWIKVFSQSPLAPQRKWVCVLAWRRCWQAFYFLGRGDIQPQLNSAMQDVSDKYILLEETEKQALRKALIEERQRFCCFVAMLRPVVDEETSMLGELTHLQTISEDLKALTSDPHKLPPACEQVITDLKASDYGWLCHTPPSSPSTTTTNTAVIHCSLCVCVLIVSHFVSSPLNLLSLYLLYYCFYPPLCSIFHLQIHIFGWAVILSPPPASFCLHSSLNSVNSSDSRGSSGSHSHSPSSSSSSSSSHHLFQNHHPRHRYRSSTLPQQTPARLSSISSHDSGFISSSQDQNPSSKSSSPMSPCPSSSSSELSNGFDHYSPAGSPHLYSSGGSVSFMSGNAFPFFPSTSASSPTRSWSRPASALLPDHPPYCTLGSPMFPSSRVPSWKDWAKPGPYDQPMVNTLRRRKGKDTSAVVDNNSGGSRLSGQASTSAPSAHDELALALSRGLELDTQRSSRDSIQCSSGYSTQTNTPCCSEDTIPSQVSDCDYFSMQSDFDKSSTIPRNSDFSQSYRRMFQTKRPASTAVIITPGVATIRRTPSKPSTRRSGSVGAGPIPIRTPVIPVKTPTPPDGPGVVNGSRGASTNPPPVPRGGGGGEVIGDAEEGNMLVAIRKGVKLKKTLTNDRSAPRIA